VVDTAVPVDRHAVASLGAGALVGGVAVVAALVDPAGGPALCPFRSLTGLDCPLCGATRAAHHLFRGDLVAAADLNVLFLVLAPALLAFAFVVARRALGGPPIEPVAFGRRAAWTLVGVVVAFWVVRNLAVPGLDWMATAA
jgi:hypothetical protein